MTPQLITPWLSVRSCNHGWELDPPVPCPNARSIGSSFCADHQPEKHNACACGSVTGIKKMLIISRKGIYPDEEGWVCPQCLVNDAPGFEFFADASEEDEP